MSKLPEDYIHSESKLDQQIDWIGNTGYKYYPLYNDEDAGYIDENKNYNKYPLKMKRKYGMKAESIKIISKETESIIEDLEKIIQRLRG
jgi:hypothetical protein